MTNYIQIGLFSLLILTLMLMHGCTEIDGPREYKNQSDYKELQETYNELAEEYWVCHTANVCKKYPEGCQEKFGGAKGEIEEYLTNKCLMIADDKWDKFRELKSDKDE